jgi:hypothetical protein
MMERFFLPYVAYIVGMSVLSVLFHVTFYLAGKEKAAFPRFEVWFNAPNWGSALAYTVPLNGVFLLMCALFGRDYDGLVTGITAMGCFMSSILACESGKSASQTAIAAASLPAFVSFLNLYPRIGSKPAETYAVEIAAWMGWPRLAGLLLHAALLTAIAAAAYAWVTFKGGRGDILNDQPRRRWLDRLGR